MLKVQFFRPDGIEIHGAGPFPWARLEGASLRAGPDGNEIASHEGGLWKFQGGIASKLILHASTCMIRFEGETPDDTTTVGPLDRVDVLNGALYAQPGGRLLARLDEEVRAWHSFENDRTWSGVVIERWER